jgi:hypothetical protein
MESDIGNLLFPSQGRGTHVMTHRGASRLGIAGKERREDGLVLPEMPNGPVSFALVSRVPGGMLPDSSKGRSPSSA